MKQNVIVCQGDSEVLLTAVRFLTGILLRHTDRYPLCVRAEDYIPADDLRPFFLGTRADSPGFFSSCTPPPAAPEGYRITVRSDAVYLEGSDDNGALYACIDLETRYLLKIRLTHTHMPFFRDAFASALPDASFASAPAVRSRGLWTWGHTITDYRGYLDNMVRTKLNTLILWNDHVPVNARQIAQYAHACGIRLYWGYSWCWDTDCSAFDLNRIDDYVHDIVAEYESSYAHLGGDGIYFQSFTELSEETIGDVLIADAVTRLVNQAAQRILEKHPDLDIQFGLHATSVRERLDYIARTDPRVRITWEDCGAFPYAYLPEQTDGFDETCAFVRRLLRLRGQNERFGSVLKGFTCLDWTSFQHLRGPHMLGVSTKDTADRRAQRKAEVWRLVQAYWLRNAGHARKMLRLMAHESCGDLCLTALMEDGAFESLLPFPAALWAQMLWDPDQDLQDLLCDTALRPDVHFY